MSKLHFKALWLPFHKIAHIAKDVAGKSWGIFRRHPKKSIAGIIILIPIAFGAMWLFKEEPTEYILAVAERGDIQQTVEAVGEVISEKDLQLKFPVTGVVAEVFVKEGDEVTKDQELARLRNDALQADVSAANARLASVNADLQELKEGTRPEDIYIAEAEVANKRAALAAAQTTFSGAEEKLKTAKKKLDSLQKETETALAGYVSTSQSTASKQLTTARTSSKVVDDVFLDNSVRISVDQSQPSNYSTFLREKESAENAMQTAAISLPSKFADYREALAGLKQVRSAIAMAASSIDYAYRIMASLDLSGALTYSDREAHKATLTTESKNAQSALSATDTAIKELQDAAANYDTLIATEENTLATAQSTKESAMADILTYETALRTQEAELLKKKAGARQTEINAAQADVNQAYAELQRVRAQLEDTILRAPMDGVITKVDMKAGEFTGDIDNYNYAISLLGESPYRVEMYVAEIDIPKVKLSQSGALELDAFPNLSIPMYVSEIDPIATDKDGVSKYLITLDFTEPPEGLRIGMSGDAEIYTDQRLDVIMIPGRAVQGNNGDEVVRILTDKEKVEERTVVTGIDGASGDVEVISGIEEGEIIIVLIKD